MNPAKSLLEAGKVARWHTEPSIAPQTNAAHSWGVAVLLLLHHPDCSLNLLKAAILHDAHEKDFGDFPSPAKIKYPVLKEIDVEARSEFLKRFGLEDPFLALTDEEKALLKKADLLEAAFHVTPEDRASVIAGRLMNMLDGLYAGKN